MQAKLAIIILKARQLGDTAISEALLAHQVLFFSNTRAVMASDHPDNSLKLFRVLTNIVDNLPGWMKPVISDRVKANNLHFPGLECDVMTGAGNQRTTFGQGMTVDAAHLTEVSTWAPENAHAIDADLRPAFGSSRRHHSLFLIESTGAGGKGNWYHDQYQAARSGKSMFKGIFLGWFMCPDKYKLDPEGITIKPETEQIMRRIEAETGEKVNKWQAAWYQTEREDLTSSGKLAVFLQEFPSFAEEAFQMGYRSAFSFEIRTKVRESCKIPEKIMEYNVDKRRFEAMDLNSFLQDENDEKINNKLVIWEKSKKGYTYVVGVDASYGIDGGDNSSIQVLRVGNKWAPDEQVADIVAFLQTLTGTYRGKLVGDQR
jgi:hypothetical protein